MADEEFNKKTENINIRLTDDDKEKAEDLARQFTRESLIKFTTSDIIRIALARLHNDIFKTTK